MNHFMITNVNDGMYKGRMKYSLRLSDPVRLIAQTDPHKNVISHNIVLSFSAIHLGERALKAIFSNSRLRDEALRFHSARHMMTLESDAKSDSLQ